MIAFKTTQKEKYLLPYMLFFQYIFQVSFFLNNNNFLGVMIRLLLVLAPAMCVVGGIGASYSIRVFSRSLK